MPDTLLAFDFGEKRIGVAVGNTIVGIAHPLQTIATESNDERFSTIGHLIAEWQPAQLVVGLPSHMDGTEHELSRLCRKFANRLRRLLHCICSFGRNPADILDAPVDFFTG